MQAECSDIYGELESWYSGENGRYLLAGTREVVRGLLDTSFGYHILQLGVHCASPLYDDSPINHRIYCADRQGQGVALVARPDELPLDSDSVDTVIAHHCLEFAANPHQALREMQRVLVPQGRLLIVGFNPYSLHGLGTRVRALLKNPLWSRHRPLSEARLTDWLHLLGCEVSDNIRLYSVPPFGKDRLRRWLTCCDARLNGLNLPAGGLYILQATKQVVAAYRPRRVRRTRGDRLIGLVPKPAAAPVPRKNLVNTYKAFEIGDVAA